MFRPDQDNTTLNNEESKPHQWLSNLVYNFFTYKEQTDPQYITSTLLQFFEPTLTKQIIQTNDLDQGWLEDKNIEQLNEVRMILADVICNTIYKKNHVTALGAAFKIFYTLGCRYNEEGWQNKWKDKLNNVYDWKITSNDKLTQYRNQYEKLLPHLPDTLKNNLALSMLVMQPRTHNDTLNQSLHPATTGFFFSKLENIGSFLENFSSTDPEKMDLTSLTHFVNNLNYIDLKVFLEKVITNIATQGFMYISVEILSAIVEGTILSLFGSDRMKMIIRKKSVV